MAIITLGFEISFWLSKNLRAYVQHPSWKLGRICMDRFGGLSKPIIQPTQLLSGMWQYCCSVWVWVSWKPILSRQLPVYFVGLGLGVCNIDFWSFGHVNVYSSTINIISIMITQYKFFTSLSKNRTLYFGPYIYIIVKRLMCPFPRKKLRW